MSITRYIFFVFSIVAVLLAAVYLRRINNSSFYDFRAACTTQSRLKQRLWQKQLQLERMINPASITEKLEKNVISGAGEKND
ncbi:MAG: hypothetical protein K8R02_00380 [Anaerohalosphaeraceae bacterium]|nr:hypothetical protein [Anaerohalosphaeraceae bacterium]